MKKKSNKRISAGKTEKLFKKIIVISSEESGPQKNISVATALSLCVEVLNSRGSNSALTILDQVEKQVPSLIDTYLLKSQIFLNQQRMDDASLSIEKALALDSRNISAIFHAAKEKRLLNDHEKSLDILKRLLKLDPRNKDVYNEIGSCYGEMGDKSAAFNAFNSGIRLNPQGAMAYWNRSQVSKTPLTEGEFSKMLGVVEGNSLESKDRALISFSIAKDYSLRKEVDLEFAHLKVANKLISETMPYDAPADRKFFESVTNDFDENVLEALEKYQCNDVRSALVVGMPRTGSSLVEQILSAHDGVLATGESNIFTNAVVSADSAKRHSARVGMGYGWDKYAENLVQQVKGFGRAKNCTGRFFTDKTLTNYQFLGFILPVFPQVKVINVQRHPLDVALSCYRMFFPAGIEFSYDLKHIAQKYQVYNDFMNYWAELFPDRILNLKYEELVKNQELETRRLLDFLGLDWDAACLKFYDSNRSVATASASQVKQPIYAEPSGRWEKFARHLAPAAAELGIDIPGD